MSKEKEKRLSDHWTLEIKNGLKYKEKFGNSKDWSTYKDYYRCNWPGNTEVPVNHTFSYVRSMGPRIFFTNPRVSVTPRRPEFIWHARVVESVLNYLIEELKIKKQMKAVSLDPFPCGVGIIKTGYDSEFGYSPSQDINEGETVTQISRKDGTSIEYNKNVKPGFPWALRTRPEEIITPWGYSDPDSFPWVIHQIIRPLKDVKGDQKFKNTKNLKGGFVIDDNRHPIWKSGFSAEGTEPYSLLYEIQDLKSGKLIVMSENQILVSEDDPLQIEGHKYVFVTYNEDFDHFWGIPDIKALEPQQLEANQIRSSASLHRKLAVVKFLYIKGALTQEALDKLLGTDIGPGIEISGGDSIQQVVQTLQPHVPPDLWKEMAETMNDARETLGFSRGAAGEFQVTTPPTATEVVDVREGREIRTSERRDIMADAFIDTCKKLLQYVFKFWTQDRVERIVGPDGKQHWIRFTGADLQGEYNFKLDPESGRPVTSQERQVQAARLFTMFANSPYVDQLQLHKLVASTFEVIDPTWPLVVNAPPGSFVPGGQAGSKGPLGSQGPSGKPSSIDQAVRKDATVRR
jgi:hypothetical protein